MGKTAKIVIYRLPLEEPGVKSSPARSIDLAFIRIYLWAMPIRWPAKQRSKGASLSTGSAGPSALAR
jgi:hypothetical protein